MLRVGYRLAAAAGTVPQGVSQADKSNSPSLAPARKSVHSTGENSTVRPVTELRTAARWDPIGTGGAGNLQSPRVLISGRKRRDLPLPLVQAAHKVHPC